MRTKNTRSKKARKTSSSADAASSSRRSSTTTPSSTTTTSLNVKSGEKTKIKSEKVSREHLVTDTVIVKYRENYYFNSFFSRLSVGEKAHMIKSLKRTPIFVRVEGAGTEDYLKNVTNYMRQFKQAFYPCHLKPSTLLFSFKVIAEERASDIEKEFLDGKEFVNKAKQGTVDPTEFRAIIDLDFKEIIWRDEHEISLTLITQPISEISDLSNEQAVTYDIIKDKDEVDIDEIDFDEEFELDLMEEQAENNLILEGQHEFITKLFNIEMMEKSSTSRPEFDPKFYPKSHQIFKAIEEGVKIFVGSASELTATALTSCLNYLYDQSKDIYQCKDFQLFEASSLQIYMVHCLKIVRSECFARNYHPTRLEHEKFKRIALANMKGAITCSKLMVASSLNYFFTDNDSTSTNDIINQNISSSSSSTTHNNVNMEQLLGKWLKLSGN
ncbi:predicted protein [Naegleria gruberi]|uniref:Predicted protein n=1 Tax=Naegleria gruberi TaxID=5762 RepID=D2W2Q5_NAEGR|nr:uncharacterized protein NAEGRDRAFT_75672 [Naegleria gruberi]EFC36686.1 predicted protein [Naegleria gruberi]|eukprot:XP_002669430.1 predicted protein [Naegleria gruberi strain NEG-M]